MVELDLDTDFQAILDYIGDDFPAGGDKEASLNMVLARLAAL